MYVIVSKLIFFGGKYNVIFEYIINIFSYHFFNNINKEYYYSNYFNESSFNKIILTKSF